MEEKSKEFQVKRKRLEPVFINFKISENSKRPGGKERGRAEKTKRTIKIRTYTTDLKIQNPTLVLVP